MATKQSKHRNHPGNTGSRKTSTLRAENEQLQVELKELRAENRQLKKSLGALAFKGEPEMMDLTPEAGVTEPSLTELIAGLERAGKK